MDDIKLDVPKDVLQAWFMQSENERWALRERLLFEALNLPPDVVEQIRHKAEIGQFVLGPLDWVLALIDDRLNQGPDLQKLTAHVANDPVRPPWRDPQ